MKRVIFLILLAVIGVAKVSAQEVDLSQENSKDARIEELSQEVKELSQKLEELQRDYAYLDCYATLSECIQDLKILYNDIYVNTRGVENSMFHVPFDIGLYDAYCDYYEHTEELIENHEETIDALNAKVEAAISRYDFLYLDINVLNAAIKALDKQLSRVKIAFGYYNSVLDLYKKKSKY